MKRKLKITLDISEGINYLNTRGEKPQVEPVNPDRRKEMNHSIKINRSRKLAKFLPMAQAEIEASIPEILIATLTASQLAQVRIALNIHWHKAVAHTEASIVGEGCVWSPRHGKLIELNLPTGVL